MAGGARRGILHRMLGYTYKDIQAFGNSLTWAIDTAKSQGEEQQYKQLLIVWDFFEGLLAEGYVADVG